MKWSDNGKWIQVTPLMQTVDPVERAVAVSWIALGADDRTPFRPWPQLGIEVRPNSSVLGWFVFLGVALCIQTKVHK